MASIHFLIAVTIVAAVVAPTLAKEFMVGDEKGWTNNFDYQAWAAGKEFHVGDKLIFKYPQGVHNVYKVDGTAFQLCEPPATIEPLTTGNDVITLSTPGRKWYLCGVGSHCVSGNQKLAITVLPQVGMGTLAPATAPTTPTSAASGIVPSRYFGLIVTAFGVIRMIKF
ncbi:unnamed protein product [Ilex paraguariensis]|uniref:Phytocyanin domain-containing protein n=1 Tax=Ilex paraguariensis TaxID=185542 RepID=A0ABC8TVA2_9AQUA